MTDHSLFPGYLKVNYTAGGQPHTQKLPVDPVLVSGAWELTRPVAGTVPLATYCNAYAAVLKPLLSSTGSVNDIELWTLASPTDDPIFRTSVFLAVAGTGTGGFVKWSEMVLTLRTDLGGILKIYVMEGISAVDVKTPAAGFTGAQAALATYLLTPATACVVGRDGGNPITAINIVSKTNDALRNRGLNP